jgi:preprotein translocase SecF subunit
MDIGVVRKRITTDIVDEIGADSLKDPDPARRAALEQMKRDLSQARVQVVGTEGNKFELTTTIAEKSQSAELQERLIKRFSDVLAVKRRLTFRGSQLPERSTAEELLAQKLIFPITDANFDKLMPGVSAAELSDNDLSRYAGGVAISLEGIDPPQSATELAARISNLRGQQDPRFAAAHFRDVKVIPVEYAPNEPPGMSPRDRLLTRAVVVVADQNTSYQPDSTDDTWAVKVAQLEWSLTQQALTSQEQLEGVTTFDAVVADSAKQQAIVAIIVSLGLILAYVWVRFGGLRYGIGAILSLAHDAIVAVAATVLCGVLVHKLPGVANALLISDFKINLTMIAAYLTIIGYSVNDTIVIFDRIRENRGRSMTPLTAKLVNDSINQCFGRTIWTTFTVFIVVLIMYIWGGEGVRGFSFAMLIGVFTGAYSTLAIAAPALLNVKEMAAKAPVKLPTEPSPLRDSGLAPRP